MNKASRLNPMQTPALPFPIAEIDLRFKPTIHHPPWYISDATTIRFRRGDCVELMEGLNLDGVAGISGVGLCRSAALNRLSHAFCPHDSTTVAVQQPIRKRHFPCYEEQVVCFDSLQLDSPVFTRRTSSTPDKTLAISFSSVSFGLQVKVRLLGCNRSSVGGSAGGKGDTARRYACLTHPSISVDVDHGLFIPGTYRRSQDQQEIRVRRGTPFRCCRSSVTTTSTIATNHPFSALSPFPATCRLESLPTARPIHRRLKRLAMTSVKPRILHLLSRCWNPTLSIVEQMLLKIDHRIGRLGCHYAYDPSSAAALSRPTIASATVGHLLHISDLDVVAVRQGLIQHHMAWRAAILSILEGPLNFQDIHVVAPGAPATRV
ncbi:hypothetical protein BKA70DRAFT_1408269 [Coprinopsis sp. MPI-PUGE-AT-0042]|nr:hypothetical protein BKA70DRAFT_1408269 [Coprinopsis sp. MPI-PUGE-AT-0042]